MACDGCCGSEKTEDDTHFTIFFLFIYCLCLVIFSLSVLPDAVSLYCFLFLFFFLLICNRPCIPYGIALDTLDLEK
jgi:hypothetical protein